MAKKSRKRANEAVREPKEAEVVETRVRRAEEDSDAGNSLVRNAVIVVLVLLGLILLFNFISNRGDEDNGNSATGDDTAQVEGAAEDQEDADDEAETEGDSVGQPGNTRVNETDSAYEFTVGDGESYTTMARRAVASIDSDLTTAERVAAETRLAQEAGAGWLNAGQDLTLSKDTVRAAVDWAKGLTAEQKAAWQPYADLVAW